MGEDEIYEVASLFSKLPHPNRIREHIKLAIEKNLIEPSRINEIFGSPSTVSRIRKGKRLILRYEELKEFYGSFRQPIPERRKEIEERQEKEILEYFKRKYGKDLKLYGQLDFPREVCKRMLERIKEFQAIGGERVALDIATGPSANAAIQIAPYVGKVFAIDVSADVVKNAIEEVESKGLRNIEVLEMNMEEMSSDWNEQFDIVLLNLVPITEKALREVSRVLKPKGIVAFSSFGEESFKEIYEAMSEVAEKLGLRDRYLGPRPPLTIGALDRIFKRSGLRMRLGWIDETFEKYEIFSSVGDALSFMGWFKPISDLFPFKEQLDWRELMNLVNEMDKNLGRNIKVSLNIIFAIGRR